MQKPIVQVRKPQDKSDLAHKHEVKRKHQSPPKYDISELPENVTREEIELRKLSSKKRNASKRRRQKSHDSEIRVQNQNEESALQQQKSNIIVTGPSSLHQNNTLSQVMDDTQLNLMGSDSGVITGQGSPEDTTMQRHQYGSKLHERQYQEMMASPMVTSGSLEDGQSKPRQNQNVTGMFSNSSSEQMSQMM